jgi:hypothetical protein
MLLTKKHWVTYGRTMMLFSGLILLIFPLYTREDFIHTFLKLWVMLHGLACILLYFASRGD